MKLLILALALILLFTAGEALNCHHCASSRPEGPCQTSVETCKPNMDTCIAIRFFRPPFTHSQSCISAMNCRLLTKYSYIDRKSCTVKCCYQDMCNTF